MFLRRRLRVIAERGGFHVERHGALQPEPDQGVLFLSVGGEAVEIEYGDAGTEIRENHRDVFALAVLGSRHPPYRGRKCVVVDHVFLQRRDAERAGGKGAKSISAREPMRADAMPASEISKAMAGGSSCRIDLSLSSSMGAIFRRRDAETRS